MEMDEQFITNLTDVWLCAYLRALEKTKNENLAQVAAFSIATNIAQTMENRRMNMQRENNPMAALMAAVMGNVQREQKKDPEGKAAQAKPAGRKDPKKEEKPEE